MASGRPIPPEYQARWDGRLARRLGWLVGSVLLPFRVFVRGFKGEWKRRSSERQWHARNRR
jgi:hypothetical protein